MCLGVSIFAFWPPQLHLGVYWRAAVIEVVGSGSPQGLYAATMISKSATAAGRYSNNGYTSTRPAVLGLAKIVVLGLGQLSMTSAAPVKMLLHIIEEDPPPEEPSLWLYLTTALILVLLGGAFAGLTIA